MKARVIELPEVGVARSLAQNAVEALDRIVEVVSGNTPHASSAPTANSVSFFFSRVNAVLKRIRFAAMLAISCSLHPSSLLYANSVWDAVEAGHLTWSNATTNWLANGDLVVKCNTVEGRGSV